MAKRDRTPLLADEDILRAAAAIWERRMVRHGVLGDLQSSANYLKAKLAHYDYEVFAVLFLDTHYRILAYEEMFRGTIDGCTVHPREVVRRSIFHNAAAVILVHFVARHKMRILCPVFLCAVLGGQERTSWASGQNRGT